MRKTIAISILLLFAFTSFATSPTTSNASLKGTYVFMASNTKLNNWGQNLICGGNPVFMGGSDVRPAVILGTLTFDGVGGITGSAFEYGKLDQTASNNTASCASGGNAVYQAPISDTITGTYSVQSNGTGTAILTPSTGSPTNIDLQLVGNCASTGVNDTFLMTVLETNNRVGAGGLARLQ